MKRISKTKDPGGTVSAVGVGTFAAAAAVLLGCPPAALLAVPAALITKAVCSAAAAEEIDKISLTQCDEIAKTWKRNRLPGEKSVIVASTRSTDNLLAFPKTRIHRYKLTWRERWFNK